MSRSRGYLFGVPAPADFPPKPGTLLGGDWVYHNTTEVNLAGIQAEGMEAGSFAERPIDFCGHRVWLAVRKADLAPFNTHDYGGVLAYEPTWEVWDKDFLKKERRRIPSELLVRVNSRGRVVRWSGK